MALMLLNGCDLIRKSEKPIGRWWLSATYPIEVAIYRNRMDVRWIHSNSTLTYKGIFKENSFYGHKLLDPTASDLNQATILKDGSLESHFLKKPNVIFQKTYETEQGAAANP